MTYDKNNIFAKIIKGDIPCSKVYDNKDVMAFYDINPKAKTHILVIPKGEYTTFSDFMSKSNANEVNNFFNVIQQIIKDNNLHIGGYKLITNNGVGGGQEVPHFHVHILGN